MGRISHCKQKPMTMIDCAIVSLVTEATICQQAKTPSAPCCRVRKPKSNGLQKPVVEVGW